MNARFWVYHRGSFVKLTMRPEDELVTREHSSHEEGYSYRESLFYFDGWTVTMTVHTEGRDCDGRASSDFECECALSRLSATAPREEGDPHRPEWRELRYRQRDYTAEAAGY